MNWSDPKYIVAQVLTVVMYLITASSYFGKHRRVVLIMNIVATASVMVAYVLMNAWTGVAMCFVALVRSFYLAFDARKHGRRMKIRRSDVVFLVLIYILTILVTIPTYDGCFWSLLTVFATAIYSFSLWQKNLRIYKFCGIPSGALWVGYNIYIQSFMGIILESALLVVAVAGYLKEIRAGARRVHKASKLSKR